MTAKAGGILCLNAGSSSLKFAVYGEKAAATGGDESRLMAAAVERIGQSLAPYPSAQRVALLPSVVRVMLAAFREEPAAKEQ